MQDAVLTKLRRDFDTAITSRRNMVTLDPSIAELRERISQAAFFESFSIYSRSKLRKIDGCLGLISNARLKDDPLEVALAVDDILQLFDGLEITMRQSTASKERIEAGRWRKS